MINLKEINFGLNRFCGPSVLSALTGKSTDECASIISGISGRQEIRAVNTQELLKAFDKLGFDTIQVNGGTTLYGTLMRLVTGGNGFYVIFVPHHVVAVEVQDKQIYLVDNHSKQVINAASSARLTQKVIQVYQVIKRIESVFVRSEIEIRAEDENCLNINRHTFYKNPKDNTMVNLGYFFFRDEQELQEIITKLSEMRKTSNENDIIFNQTTQTDSTKIS